MSKKLVLFIGVLAILASGCSDYSVPTDSVACVYGAGGSDGLDLKDQRLPGSEPFNVRQGREIVEVPTSDRFYLITTSDATRDPGAPQFIAANDSPTNGVTELRFETKNNFVFNAATACQWFNQHGLRNAIDYDMKFNVRGELTPWLQWLSENFALSMDRAVNQVSREFSWEQLTFNYPVGANELGIVPDDASEADLRLARTVAEERLEEIFFEELNERIGTHNGTPFFCNIGHNQANPDSCDPIGIEILDVNPTDNSLVEARQNVQSAQEDLNNAQQLEEINAQQALLNATQRERQEAEAIAEAQSQARQEAARLRAELGITDENVDILELEVRRAENEARLAVQPCIQSGVTGIDCVLLLAVLNGIDLPQIMGELGSSVQLQVPVE